jgi:hypothetical protein
LFTIDSYRFGEIVINGRKYTSDVIIFPDRVQDDWWRDESHELTLKDISGILSEKPEILLVGTGASGMMRVLPEVERESEASDIQLIVQPTGEACDIYNQLAPTQKTVAALHLTC